MKLNILLVAAILCLSNFAGAEEIDALRECSNIHHLEFRAIQHSNASYSNHNCMLKCSVGDKVLSNDAINEGFKCPLNPDGVCHNGQCIGPAENRDTEALRECGNMNHINFKNSNNTNAAYSNSKCYLECKVGGEIISAYAMNEGYTCPKNANGICRSGHCIIKTAQPTTVANSNPLATIQAIDIIVHDGNFFHNQSSVYLSACLQKVKEKHFVSTNCKQWVTTRMISHSSRHIVWNQTLKIRGPFNKESFLLINMWNGKGTTHANLGNYGETLDEIYYVHLPANRKHSDDKYFFKLYPLVHENKYLGDVKLEFEFLNFIH